MIKFEVKDRRTSEVKFVAEIDCGHSDEYSIKLGLAIEWGIKNNTDLNYANLSYANLRYANLRGADLHGADLHGADLHGADLHGANLSYANLRYANLRGANLSCADLRGADLHGADLHGVILHGVNLRGAKNCIIPIPISMVGDKLRTGYAVWDRNKNDVMVCLGCRYDTEEIVYKAVSEKYGEDSGYAMMVKAACRVARERKILNPIEE